MIIFSAPSGSGKTTIVRHLIDLDIDLVFSVSATSRPPRNHEKHGVDYYFLTPEEFRRKADAGDFIEWEEVYTNQYYGTLKAEIERLRELGKHVLFDIDVEGGLNLKRQFGTEALAIFIQPPSIKVMEERLRKRGTDPEDQLRKRLDKAAQELEYASKFDQVILNDQLDIALERAEFLIRSFIDK